MRAPSLILFFAMAAAATLGHAAPLPSGITSQLPAGYEVITFAAGALMLFTQGADGSYRLAKRNDHVVFGINDGGQCDPFDEDDGLVIKNQYFTVQNGVGCGSHWTDYITFKYDATLHDWVFSKRVFESWRMNLSNKPNVDALIRENRQVWTGDKKQPVLFEAYRAVEK